MADTNGTQRTGGLATALGPATLDGAVLTKRQRAIVAALVLHRHHEIATDCLIDAVWGERAPSSARQSLQNHIGRLRAAHGTDVITTGAEGYRLGRPTDVDRFEELVGAHLVATPRADGIAPLSAGLALWAGTAFVDLPEAPRVDAERARLAELRALAAEQLVECRLVAGRLDEALRDLPGLTLEEPYRERRWALLMTALNRCGRAPEALEAYERLALILQRDLQTAPSGPLQQLRASIAREAVVDLDDGSRRASRGPFAAAAGAPEVVPVEAPCTVRRAQRRQRTCSAMS